MLTESFSFDELNLIAERAQLVADGYGAGAIIFSGRIDGRNADERLKKIEHLTFEHVDAGCNLFFQSIEHSRWLILHEKREDGAQREAGFHRRVSVVV
jgi:hypothetical protein